MSGANEMMEILRVNNLAPKLHQFTSKPEIRISRISSHNGADIWSCLLQTPCVRRCPFSFSFSLFFENFLAFRKKFRKLEILQSASVRKGDNDLAMEYGSVSSEQRRSPPRLSPVNSNPTETRIAMGHNRDADDIVPQRHRFPHSIVWTPIPFISWIFPFIGHMGIALSSGVIRDFAGSYYVSEDEMAFGWPTRYWQLPLDKVAGGAMAFDKGVLEASEEYKHRTHNLCCDNCHSHVALALNTMNYDGNQRWNMVNLTFMILVKGKYVGFGGFLKQWLPFVFALTLFIVIIVVLPVATHR